MSSLLASPSILFHQFQLNYFNPSPIAEFLSLSCTRDLVDFIYSSRGLISRLGSWAFRFCSGNKITYLFVSFRIPRRSLRGEYRRLSGQPLSKWRHLHGPSERVLLFVPTGLHGHAVRAGCGRVLGTAVLVPQRGHMHEFARQLLVYMRERLDRARLQRQHRWLCRRSLLQRRDLHRSRRQFLLPVHVWKDR